MNSPIELAKELLRLREDIYSDAYMGFRNKHCLAIAQALLDAEARLEKIGDEHTVAYLLGAEAKKDQMQARMKELEAEVTELKRRLSVYDNESVDWVTKEEYAEIQGYIEEQDLKICRLEAEVKILTNPSDGRCMDIEAMRTRLKDANAEIELHKQTVRMANQSLKELESEIQRLTKSREGSIK